MYIKSIVINGFKVYKGRVVIEDLDPGLNVIVGRNGSGKTTFFDAIQFVLSEKFSHLNQKERQLLFPYNRQFNFLSVYVEVKIDNTDRMLPFPYDEICLKRDISLKKDQFTLNGKQYSKDEIKQSFQLGGFYTHGASFNIIEQGMVNSLAVANDSKRLAMLKQVSGTNRYEEKIKEAKIVLEELGDKIKEIAKLIKSFDRQLKKLDKDKKGLSEYQELDERRRCIDYILHDQNLKRVEKELEAHLSSHEDIVSMNKELQSEVLQAKEQVQIAEQSLAEINEKFDDLKQKDQALGSDHCKLVEERNDLMLQIQNLTNHSSSGNIQKDLKKLDGQISELEKKLKTASSKFNECKSAETNLLEAIDSNEQKSRELLFQKDRCNQFKSKKERDQYIKLKLKEIKTEREEGNKRFKKLLDEKAKDEEQLEGLEQLQRQLDEHTAKLEENKKVVFDFDQKKFQLLREQNELRRDESDLKIQIAKNNEKIDKFYHSIMRKPIINGIKSVQKVLESFKQRNGYCGLLADNFDCNETLYTAINNIAKNRLFYLIVETEEFGNEILNEMNRQKLPGEVTFLPLDKLYVKKKNYPKSKDAKPVSETLIYDEKFDAAIKFVFSQTLLCRDLELAMRLAKTSKFDCIDMNGNQVSGNGLVTGGYLNPSKLRFPIYKKASQIVSETSTLKEKLTEIEEKIRKNDERINSYTFKIHEINTETSKLRVDVDQMKDANFQKQKALKEVETRVRENDRTISQLRSSLKEMKAIEESLKNELGQDITERLSVTDELDALKKEKQILTEKQKKTCKDYIKFQLNIGKIEQELNTLIGRRNEIIESRESPDKNHEGLKKQLDDVTKKILKVETSLTEIKKTISATSKQKEAAETELENWRKIERQAQQLLAGNKSFLNYSSKKNFLMKKVSELKDKMEQLVTPRGEIYEQYNSKSMSDLSKAANKCQKKLKKYSALNLKAFEAYTNASHQKDDCVETMKKVKQNIKGIEGLIEAGKNKFDKFVQSAINNIGKHFSKIFEKLIPSGQAQLVIRGTRASETDDNASDDSVDFVSLTGVGTQVFFPGNEKETKDIAQLSNGQKTLVALALIFAIQKCNPVPVYLFDEFDQNLDPQHRKSVAEMFHDLSSTSQIMIITFRPELLQHADNLYQVECINGVSHINPLSRQEAENLVQSDKPCD